MKHAPTQLFMLLPGLIFPHKGMIHGTKEVFKPLQDLKRKRHFSAQTLSPGNSGINVTTVWKNNPKERETESKSLDEHSLDRKGCRVVRRAFPLPPALGSEGVQPESRLFCEQLKFKLRLAKTTDYKVITKPS